MKPGPSFMLLGALSLSVAALACGPFSSPPARSAGDAPVMSPSPARPTGDAPIASPSPAQPTPVAVATSLQATQSAPETPLPAGDVPLLPAQDTDHDGVIGICEVVPASVWEDVMGRPQAGAPAPFEDPALGKGCAFDFGQDSGAAYFAYVTFATDRQFGDALAAAVQPEPVTTVGDSAFLNYGPDARQLWVRVGNQAAMVAIGDRENLDGMTLIASYLVQALQARGG